MELALLVTWLVTETSSGKPCIEGWLPGQENYPFMKLYGGDKLFSGAVTDKGHQRVYDGDLPQLFRAVAKMGELSINMKFSVKYDINVNQYGFVNNRIRATWTGHDGTEREGSFGPFNYSVKMNQTFHPQWYFEDTRTYVDIVSGGGQSVFKNLVEAAYRQHIGEEQASLISAYKRKSKKKKLTKKLRAKLASMEQDEGVHNAFCTQCGMFCASRKTEAGDERTYSCALGVWAAFDSKDITSDIYERNGVTQEGGKLKSIRGDALWAWTETEDAPLTFSQLLSICRVIDRESCSWLGSVEEGASMLEFLWDDVLWIEHLNKRGLLSECTDLDALIKEHRDKLVRKVQRRYAKNYPAYSDLFLQRAASDEYQQEAQVETTLEEVGEKAHTVSTNNFLNTYILSACGLGFRSVKKGDRYNSYLYRGYPVPTEFGFSVVED